jgi:glycosyltransferase involved in cell wall biosynthesis
VVTVRNGIDPEPFISGGGSTQEARASLGLPKDVFLIGTVGRLDPTKAPGHLIDAFNVLVRQGADAYLALAGEGRLRHDLEAQIASLGLENRVILMGHMKEIPQFLRSLDLFVLPSLREGLPLALLEAMASGLPVVATNTGGIPEVLSGLEGAVLVPVGDINALAVAFDRMYRSSNEELSSMGQGNRERVLKDFTWERMLRETTAVYEAVLAEGLRRTD